MTESKEFIYCTLACEHTFWEYLFKTYLIRDYEIYESSEVPFVYNVEIERCFVNS